MAHQSVALFIPCLIDAFYPEVGQAVLDIFKKLALATTYPLDQTCCGQPAFNSGFRKEARRAAKHFIRIFESAAAIVCPSGSCVHMVKNHYPELFKKNDPWHQRAVEVGRKTHELTAYLVDVLNIVNLDAHYERTVTYHDSCHLLRGLGISQQPRQLIRQVAGISFVEMENADVCCGFGGSFAVKYADISSAMVADKVRWIVESGANTVIGADMGCLMNIQGALARKKSPIKVMHIAQLLVQ